MSGTGCRRAGRWWRDRAYGRPDEGSGSVLTLAVAGTLVVLAVALGLLVQATVARARAQLVADLSALAAAREVQRASFGEPGAEQPCTRAAAVATHNGGVVVRCAESTGGKVAVDVTVPTPTGVARASARAGPRPP